MFILHATGISKADGDSVLPLEAARKSVAATLNGRDHPQLPWFLVGETLADPSSASRGPRARELSLVSEDEPRLFAGDRLQQVALADAHHAPWYRHSSHALIPAHEQQHVDVVAPLDPDIARRLRQWLAERRHNGALWGVGPDCHYAVPVRREDCIEREHVAGLHARACLLERCDLSRFCCRGRSASRPAGHERENKCDTLDTTHDNHRPARRGGSRHWRVYDDWGAIGGYADLDPVGEELMHIEVSAPDREGPALLMPPQFIPDENELMAFARSKLELIGWEAPDSMSVERDEAKRVWRLCPADPSARLYLELSGRRGNLHVVRLSRF